MSDCRVNPLYGGPKRCAFGTLGCMEPHPDYPIRSSDGPGKIDVIKEEVKVTGQDPWIHRSDNMKCKTCMWFVPKVAANPPSPEVYDLGRCRRHAPTMGGYPVVMVNDWCGDHRLDENKARPQ